MSAPPPDPGFDGERHARRLAPAGGLLVVVGLCGGGWLAAGLVPVGLLLLLLACHSRRDGFLVLGPFARAELVASARRGRPWLWRVLYALAASGMALALFLPALDRTTWAFGSRLMPRQAEYFFYLYVAVQLAYLGYLTATLFAPVAAEEREKKRWEMLLTTDLRNREILLGKTAGRLPQLLDPLLASLPVLAMLPFVGGVSPVLVGVAAVVTVSTMLGVSGVSAFYSVIAPTARKAVDQANGLMAGYYGLSFALCLAAIHQLSWTFPTSVGLASPVEVRHVVEVLNAGNPISMVFMHSQGILGGTAPLEDRLADAARKYAAFHLGLFFLFGLTAVARLRVTRAWATPAGPSPEKAEKAEKRKVRPPLDRPPIGDWPVTWQERYATLTRGQLRAVLWLTPGRLVKVAVVTAAVLAGGYAYDALLPTATVKAVDVFRVVAPGAVWMLTWGVWLAPAVRAARSIARERSAGTLEGLKLTALTPRDIVVQKWAGCVMAELPLFRLTAAVAVAGVATGFVHPAGLLALAMLPVYAGAAAAVGMFFTARAKDPTKAVRNMVLTVVFVGWLLGQLVVEMRMSGNPVGLFVVYPPTAIGAPLFAWAAGQNRGPHTGEVIQVAVAVVMGLGMYAGVGWAALRAAERRFEADRQG